MKGFTSLLLLSSVSTSLARPAANPLLEDLPVVGDLPIVGDLIKGIVGPWGLLGSTLKFPSILEPPVSGGSDNGSGGSTGTGGSDSGSGGSDTGVTEPASRPRGAPLRTVVYMQSNSNPDRLRGAATHLIVGAIHLNENSTHINDTPYDQTQIWTQLGTLQTGGMVIMGMLGGAAKGTYANLERDFNKYYGNLRAMIEYTGLRGIDIDAEERVSMATLIRLVRALRSDFGSGFTISCAPVPAGLTSRGDQWGTSFLQLEDEVGDDIEFYNTQYYCGNGNLTPSSYEATLRNSGIPASKIVAGVLTNPANCAAGGYVDVNRLTNEMIPQIRQATRDQFGGVSGWEYFNSLPGGNTAPERWAQMVSGAMR